MSEATNDAFCESQFNGTARLFPLPNLVLFPHVLQPLHVFEPRYRALVEEALATDRLLAMAMLRPGWEQDYEGRPPVYPMACLGQIVSHCRLPEGSFNVLVMGLRRVRLLDELPPDRSFRVARVEVCADLCPNEQAARTNRLRSEVRQALRRAFPRLPQAHEQIDQLLARDLPLGAMADLVAYLLEIGLPEKQALLAELDVCRRVEALLPHLARLATPADSQDPSFPPAFSSN